MVIKDVRNHASLGEESQDTKNRSKRTHTVKVLACSTVGRGLFGRRRSSSRATTTACCRRRIRRRPVRTYKLPGLASVLALNVTWYHITFLASDHIYLAS